MKKIRHLYLCLIEFSFIQTLAFLGLGSRCVVIFLLCCFGLCAQGLFATFPTLESNGTSLPYFDVGVGSISPTPTFFSLFMFATCNALRSASILYFQCTGKCILFLSLFALVCKALWYVLHFVSRRSWCIPGRCLFVGSALARSLRGIWRGGVFWAGV